MQAELRHRPTFAALFITLAPGESVMAASGAMASMSSHIQARVRFFGGFVRALVRRFFGRQSLFMSQFACPGDGRPGEVVLSQGICGDIEQIDLQGNVLYVQPGAFVACAPTVKLGVRWAGFASWFGGEGLFRLRLSGHGPAWIGSYGSIVVRSSTSELWVDTGHLLAYEPTLSLGVALSGGILTSILGGEGFVTRVRGQGRVYLQTRSVQTLADWTNAHL